jgi:hypothetical protein
VARYVIGTAAALSNDFRYAEELLADAEVKLTQFVKYAEGVPLSVLLDRVRGRLRDLYAEWSARYLRRYTLTRNDEVLRDAERCVDKLLLYDPNNYGGQLAGAMCAFVLRQDLATASKRIEACRGISDAAWMYRDAFLTAYKGELQEAYRIYHNAFRSPLEDHTVPVQCEEFIQIVLDREPDRYWLYFCLALINYRAKRDLAAARTDLQMFLERASASAYPIQVKAAQRWLEEIDIALAH